MTAINDFKQLLVQSKQEIVSTQKAGKKAPAVTKMAAHFETVLAKVDLTMAGFDEARQSIKLVNTKNSHVKSLLDQLERDLNALRLKSRRHQIQTNMHVPTSVNSGSETMSNFNLQLI